MLRRPIPEGFEIEVSITIDESRRIEVSAYVPHIDLVIEDEFMYNCEPLNLYDTVENIQKELEVLLKMLQCKRDLNSEELFELADILRRTKEFELEFNSCKNLVGIDDDRVIDTIKVFNDLKGTIQDFEKKLVEKNSFNSNSIELSRIEKAVSLYGSENDKSLFNSLKIEYKKAKNKKEVLDKMLSLKTTVMLGNFDFLKLAFLQLSSPSSAYSNIAEALEWKAKGQLSLATSDTKGLQNAVVGLLNLSVDFNSDIYNQRSLIPDLR